MIQTVVLRVELKQFNGDWTTNEPARAPWWANIDGEVVEGWGNIFDLMNGYGYHFVAGLPAETLPTAPSQRRA